MLGEMLEDDEGAEEVGGLARGCCSKQDGWSLVEEIGGSIDLERVRSGRPLWNIFGQNVFEGSLTGV